jgi:magnesium chelatase family protein
MRDRTVTVGCGMVQGVEAIPVRIEATLRQSGDGTPRLLGLVDACVREAYHRVLQAFVALDLPSPRGVTTVNFAPAALRKHGSGFDLPLALALAGAAGLYPLARARGLFAFGELSLRGQVLPARGAFSVALAARHDGAHALLTSPDDAASCAILDRLPIHGAATLADAILWLAGHRQLPPPQPRPPEAPARVPDLGDLRGHATPKLALAVAAAGGHNLLFVGPPGAGKSALLRRLPGLLPPLTPNQRIEVMQVHAAAGLPAPAGEQPPFRAPHHTSSTASLLGGGSQVRPGEVSLAHHGVLFLDELPEFRRDALEALRQPLEDGVVTVGRALVTVTMPAQCLFAAAMNPCPCGYLGHRHRPCTCPPNAVHRYRARLSGPLLDRIDLQLEVPALDAAELRAPEDPDGTTASLRRRVLAAREHAARRRSTTSNARLGDRALAAACRAGPAALHALDDVLQRHRLSARTRVRLLRVARTLADLDAADVVEESHVWQAAALRGFELAAAAP